jgi:hypothetical protein
MRTVLASRFWAYRTRQYFFQYVNKVPNLGILRSGLADRVIMAVPSATSRGNPQPCFFCRAYESSTLDIGGWRSYPFYLQTESSKWTSADHSGYQYAHVGANVKTTNFVRSADNSMKDGNARPQPTPVHLLGLVHRAALPLFVYLHPGISKHWAPPSLRAQVDRPRGAHALRWNWSRTREGGSVLPSCRTF